MATGQLVEELLIECVALLTTPRRHEYVTSNELMNNFAVSSHTAEGNVHVPFKLNGHLEDQKHRRRRQNISLKGFDGIVLTL